ncbi:MAG TPA: hypothetical protein VFM69_01180 [Pricia sp.]|nr:hypothetical protein [Pricia sp.]
MKSIYKNTIGVLLCCASLFSCVEEQDFGQYDELNITPILEASMLYVEAPESLVNDAADAEVISRNFNFDAFTSDLFSERVIDGTITYIAENTTSKQMDFRIEFLDVNGNLLDVEIFAVDPGQVYQRDIAYGSAGESIEIIKNTSSLRVTATNATGDTESVSNLPDPKIVLKSSGKFRMRVK